MHKNLRDIESELKNINSRDLLQSIFNTAVQENFPVAFYRLPNQNEASVIISFSKKNDYVPINSDTTQPGFMVSPFIKTENNVHFIKADLVVNLKNLSITSHSINTEIIDQFLERVIDLKSKLIRPDLTSEGSAISSDQYLTITKEAIQRIQNGDFKKVVLARSKSTDINPAIHPIELFNALCNHLNESFISLVSIPGNGFWIGASPELLVSTDRNNVFRTVALAGTQKAHEEKESKAVWTQKEIEEQALVVRYILNCFKSIRLREYEDDGPKTIKAGNIFHLKTDFSVNLNEVPFPDLGNIMLNLLHPTSAVCGMPKEEALNFIKNHEGLDRKFYAGYLGPVNIDQETHLFVNIRCAELLKEKANIFSGAGITTESDPAKELMETELKMQLMENLITKGSCE